MASVKSVGSLPKGGPLRSDLFIMHSPAPLELHFHGEHLENKVPSRVAFFVWTTTLGKILTLNNLRKKNVIVMDGYYMCKKSGKTIDHRLLHCEVARALWVIIYRLFGLE